MSVEIEVYLQAINAEQPCGDDLEYDPDFIALEQAIKGKPEQQIGDIIQEAEPPDWKEVRESAEQLLTRTRDLRVLIYYLRALVALEGVAGLEKGLELLCKLSETFWQNIYPQLDPEDDNDPTERVNILMALCDFDTFLKPLQKMPLINSKAFGKFSLWDINLAEGKITASDSDANIPELSSINAAFQDCDSETLKETVQALIDSLHSVDSLENFVTDQVGVGNAPGFTEIRKLLKEIHTVFLTRLGEQDPADFVETFQDDGITDEADILSVDQDSAGAVALSTIKNNNDVVRALLLICDYYKKHEPSSPVPILLERSIRLVGMDFMTIMQDMAPDGMGQVELFRGTSNVDNEDD